MNGTAATPPLSIAGVSTDGASTLSARADGDFVPNGDPRFPTLPVGVAIGDWDDLLAAVKSRLRLIVGEVRARTIEPPVRDSVAWVQDSVLECVAALDQLHTTLTEELQHRQ